MRDPHQAWYRQKLLKQRFHDVEVPDIKELAVLIGNIDMGMVDAEYQSLRAQALFALYYLTACRKTEILPTKVLRYKRISKQTITNQDGTVTKQPIKDEDGKIVIEAGKLNHNYMGLRKQDITFEEIDNRPFMLIRTENRKHKTKKTKRLPIPLEFEAPIVEYLKRYLDILRDQDVLFPFTDGRASQIINQTTGFNTHFIRHIRATHLVTIYDFNEQLLIKYMGWTNSMPAKNYMELSHKDLERQFYKGK